MNSGDGATIREGLISKYSGPLHVLASNDIFLLGCNGCKAALTAIDFPSVCKYAAVDQLDRMQNLFVGNTCCIVIQTSLFAVSNRNPVP